MKVTARSEYSKSDAQAVEKKGFKISWLSNFQKINRQIIFSKDYF